MKFSVNSHTFRGTFLSKVELRGAAEIYRDEENPTRLKNRLMPDDLSTKTA
jgi:hypothetical protein